MSRIDKWHPAVGTFRAPLNAALSLTTGPGAPGTPEDSDLSKIFVVGLNGSGRVIKATTAIMAVGIIIADRPFAAGEIIDVFTSCEVVELGTADIQGATTPTAGTKYYLDLTASRLSATAPIATALGFYVGTTVEATRLVVRAAQAGAL